MPFLRVIRDKRGYETTYLMHWYREGGRQRSRILYVFRTPGGVQVGRNALEPEVQRQLEAQHPDIAFDWKAVRENQQVVEPPPVDLRRPRKRRQQGEGDSEEPAVAPPPRAPAPAPRAAAASPQSPPRPAVPSVIVGTTPDEQIAFLSEWYPQLRDRVPQRTADTVRQAALLALAERLNPATWTDADQITAGLQQAGEALERLSHVFARRRRRPRRAASRPEPSRPDPSLPDSPRPDPPPPTAPDPSSSDQ